MADAAPDRDHQTWARRAFDSVRGLLHDADLPPDGTPPTPPPKWQVIGLNVAARALVYGPFIALAAMFVPLAIPSLLLSAGQPWTGDALSWASAKIQKAIPATKPLFQKISKLTGNKWWPAIGALAVATIPAPALLHTLAHHLPGFISSALGSVDGIWTQALPFVLISALPTATTFVEKVLDRLPILRDAALVTKWAEGLGKDVFGEPGAPAPGTPTPTSTTDAAPAPSSPAPEPATPGKGADGAVTPMLRALPLQTTPMRPLIELTDRSSPALPSRVPQAKGAAALGLDL
jgi:hypothetical protein